MKDPPATFDVPLTSESNWCILKRKANEVRAANAVRYLQRDGIESILIKGVACARYYPSGHFRDSMDTDLAVSADEFPRAIELVRLDQGALAIDVHRELRDLDTVAWQDIMRRSRCVDIGDSSIRVLAPEDHLRVLSTHWLTDGGRYKHRLWDLYYIFEQERHNLEWSALLDGVEENRRRWVICTFGVLSRFLGLDLSGTPLERAEATLPKWFVSTLEKEWQLPEFRPLFYSTRDPKEFWGQLRRRMPPNPITATIMANGSLDAPTRLFYYAANIFHRLGPSVSNTARAVLESRR